MRRILAAALAAVVGTYGVARGETDAVRFELSNGLKVILRPVAQAESVACVVLFNFGDASDPPGKSGLCHLVEHVYLTAAAGDIPASTAEAWMARYQGANGQTGRDYTVIATVFPRQRLDAEIDEAAARMRDLRIEQSDLEREWPRMELELGNMYGGMLSLAAMNLAGAAACPGPAGARKGGIMEQIRAVTIDEARDWYRHYYKPVNATLVLAGGLDTAAARKRITAAFGAIEAGMRPPSPRPVAEPAGATTQRLTVPKPDSGGPDGVAVLAFRVPQPGDELYAPFLMVAARVVQKALPDLQAAMQKRSPVSPFSYMPFDMPEIVTFGVEVNADQDDAGAIAMLRARAGEGTTLDPDEPVGLLPVKLYFGPMLGLSGLPEAMVTRDPYFLAFCLGRRQQLGLNSEALEATMKKLTADDLRRCAEIIFAPDRGALVIVRAQQAAPAPLK